MKDEWWIVIDAEGRSFGSFMGETLAEVSAKNWTEVFPTDGFRVLRVVPAEEVEALRSAIGRTLAMLAVTQNTVDALFEAERMLRAALEPKS